MSEEITSFGSAADEPTLLVEERLHRNSRLAIGPIWALLLVAAAIAVAGWYVLARTNDVEQPAVVREELILPGEAVLQNDPLVVAAASVPQLNFDTTELGTELVWEPVLEIDDEIGEWLTSLSLNPFEEDRVSLKVTVLGRLRGVPWIVEVSDGPFSEEGSGNAPTGNMRMRQVATPNASTGHSRKVPVDSRVFIDAPVEQDLHVISYGGGWVQLSSIPAGTAVVGFVDPDQKLWMQPRGGVAVFPIEGYDPGDKFIATAYDRDGRVLGSASTTVR